MSTTTKKKTETAVSVPVTQTQQAPAAQQTPAPSPVYSAQKQTTQPTKVTTQPAPQQTNTQTTQTNTQTNPQTSQQSGGSGVADILNLPGLSEQTKTTLGGLVANGYQPSANVKSALENLQTVIDQQPGEFKSKHTESLDRLLETILNRDPFTYDMSSDPAYQAYRQMYMTAGKTAMADTMGQAAALTGGYGNSYATTAGQQQYNAYLQQLADRVPELQQMALDRYNSEGDWLKTQYGIAGDAYDRDYNEWSDEYDRWSDDRDYYTDRYGDERDFDYGKYQDTTGNWFNIADYENSQYNTDREFEYNKETDERDFNYQKETDERDFNYQKETDERDFNYQKETDERDFNYQKEQDEQEQANEDRDYAYDLAMAMLEQGKMPSRELLKQAGLSDEDIDALLGGSSSGSGGSSGSDSPSGNKHDNDNSKTGLPPHLDNTQKTASTQNKTNTGTSTGKKNGTEDDKKKVQEVFKKSFLGGGD